MTYQEIIQYGNFNISFESIEYSASTSNKKLNHEGITYKTNSQLVKDYFSYGAEYEYQPKFIVWITQTLTQCFCFKDFYEHMSSLNEDERNFILSNDTFHIFQSIQDAEIFLDYYDEIQEKEWLSKD